ncbi:hypothetical protein Syun_027166 [Stephania yunnanensis]|uniref:Receptor-like serine/threonine-protein kinase n=1 Tax=Stephania yunnanensis TaxID=152371 RepID=A0AAP0EHG2_9MAGN
MVSLISLLVLHSLFINRLCHATDTITYNKFLREGETIVSDGGTYALGFFSPGISKLSYIGIWYNKIPEKTVVWVANRNNPMKDSSMGVLKINEDGNLAIFNGNEADPVWSTKVSVPMSDNISSTLIYKLLNTGNLVLRDENKEDILWQSFDYPTNTRLPGMKLGWNLKSGLNWSLTSWKSRDDPSTGDFTYNFDPTGAPEFFIKKGLRKLWRSEPWNGLAKTLHSSTYYYTFVNNPDEISIIANSYNTSVLSRLYLDELGIGRRLNWIEDTQTWSNIWSSSDDSCDYYGKCGSFGSCHSSNGHYCSCLPGFEPKSPRDWDLKDGSKGCVRERELLCGKGDGFLKLEKMKIPDTSNARVDISLEITDCEIECRNNCSCTGYSSADVNGSGSGCLVWFGELIDIRDYTEGGQDLFVRVDAIELDNSMKDSKGSSFSKKKLVLLCVLIVVGLFIFISALCCFFKKARRRGLEHKERLQELLSMPTLATNEETNAKFDDLTIFYLDTIMLATERFSLANKLGFGGFGPVYKVSCRDGREIVSCCVEEDEKMLIYEYMPNKSLDFLLFDRTEAHQWTGEYDIILFLGLLGGSFYLHQDSIIRIVHRDLKASNILLDASMNPKISDFGMARIFGGNQTEGNTNRVVGTFGYMSPEYAMDGLFSAKSDVFSFGVLLLEIISGKKNTGFYCEDPSMNLIKHAWKLWRDGTPLELVDHAMGASFPEQEVVKFIQVGILCVQENAGDRPTMSTVILMLSNDSTTIPTPEQPAFILTRNYKHPNSWTTGTSSWSANEMSTTIVEGR